MWSENDFGFGSAIEECICFIKKASIELDPTKNDKNFFKCVRKFRNVLGSFLSKIENSHLPVSDEDLEAFFEFKSLLFKFIMDTFGRFNESNSLTLEHMAKIREISSYSVAFTESVSKEDLYKDEDHHIWGIRKLFDHFVSASTHNTSWTPRLINLESLDTLFNSKCVTKLERLVLANQLIHFCQYVYSIPKIVRTCGDYQTQFLMLRIFKHIFELSFPKEDLKMIVNSLRPKNKDRNFKTWMEDPNDDPEIARLCLNEINEGFEQNQSVFSFPALYVGFSTQGIHVTEAVLNDQDERIVWINFSTKSRSICFNSNGNDGEQAQTQQTQSEKVIELNLAEIHTYCFSRFVSELENDRSYCIFHLTCKFQVLDRLFPCDDLTQNKRSIYFIFNESAKFEILLRKLLWKEHEASCSKPLNVVRNFVQYKLSRQNEEHLPEDEILGIDFDDSGNIETDPNDLDAQSEILLEFEKSQEFFSIDSDFMDAQTSTKAPEAEILPEFPDSTSPIDSLDSNSFVLHQETPYPNLELQSPAEFNTPSLLPSVIETEFPRDYRQEIKNILILDSSISSIKSDPTSRSISIPCSRTKSDELLLEKILMNKEPVNELNTTCNTSPMSPYLNFGVKLSSKSPSTIDPSERVPTPSDSTLKPSTLQVLETRLKSPVEGVFVEFQDSTSPTKSSEDSKSLYEETPDSNVQLESSSDSEFNSPSSFVIDTQVPGDYGKEIQDILDSSISPIKHDPESRLINVLNTTINSSPLSLYQNFGAEIFSAKSPIFNCSPETGPTQVDTTLNPSKSPVDKEPKDALDIYFQLSSQNDSDEQFFPTPTSEVFSRSSLLSLAVNSSPPPVSLYEPISDRSDDSSFHESPQGRRGLRKSSSSTSTSPPVISLEGSPILSSASPLSLSPSMPHTPCVFTPSPSPKRIKKEVRPLLPQSSPSLPPVLSRHSPRPSSPTSSPTPPSSGSSLSFEAPLLGSPPRTQSATKRSVVNSIDQMPPPAPGPLEITNGASRKLFSSPEFSVLSIGSKGRGKTQFTKQREFNVENISSADELKTPISPSERAKKPRTRKKLSQITNQNEGKPLLGYLIYAGIIPSPPKVDPYEYIPSPKSLKNKKFQRPMKAKKMNKAQMVSEMKFSAQFLSKDTIEKSSTVKSSASASNSAKSTPTVPTPQPKFKLFTSKNSK